MDSSGSMQSSSGGDDQEYDSRNSGSIQSTFLNHSAHFVPDPQPSFLLSQGQQNHLPTFFDPSSNYFQAFSQSEHMNSNPNSMLNLDMVRSRSSALRSETNCSTDLGNLSSSSTQSFMGTTAQFQSSFKDVNGGRRASSSSAPSDHQTHVVKNSKKRTRASRRAPTTVLTTDTSNFRAMVQEFTGIPAPPFSGSSSAFSRRLDLFGSGSGLRSGMESFYPLRPSPQKIQALAPIRFPSSSSSTSMTATYQRPSDLGFLKPQNLLKMQNPVLSFSPFVLQPPLPGYGGEKSQGSLSLPSSSSLEELGLSHVDEAAPPLKSGGNQHHHHHQHDLIRSFDENNNYGNSERGNSTVCKLNYSGPTSEFLHHEKGLENVSGRGEVGAVESWICPLD